MKFIAAATALFAGLVAASPASKQAPRDTEYVTLDFWAAADQTFSVDVPIGGSASVNSDLSFSSITSYSSDNTVCHAYGVDGSDTVLYGSEKVDIGPPQEQTTAECYYV